MKRKFLMKKDLLSIKRIEKARRLAFNRSMSEKFIKTLSGEVKFPIIESFLHNDEDVRARVVMNEEGQSTYIDMPIEFYNNLPEFESKGN